MSEQTYTCSMKNGEAEQQWCVRCESKNRRGKSLPLQTIEVWRKDIGRQRPVPVPGTIALSTTESAVLSLLANGDAEDEVNIILAACLLRDMAERSVVFHARMLEMAAEEGQS